MNLTDYLTPANVMLVAVLLIQVYKLARPFMAKTEKGAAIVSTIDRGWGFVADKAPAIFTIVEALAEKNVIKKTDKAGQFLLELRNEAMKHKIDLTPEHEAEAQFIAKTLAAQDHQPALPAGQAIGQAIGLPIRPAVPADPTAALPGPR